MEFFFSFNQSITYLHLSFSIFSPFCTCQAMDVSPTLKFNWDANQIVKSVAVSAVTWVSCLAKWMRETMEDVEKMYDDSTMCCKLLFLLA
jgi:hypothetical protein